MGIGILLLECLFLYDCIKIETVCTVSRFLLPFVRSSIFRIKADYGDRDRAILLRPNIKLL